MSGSDRDRVVALTADDLDAILDALSALAHCLAYPNPADRVREACVVQAIVQQLGAKFDLPEGPVL